MATLSVDVGGDLLAWLDAKAALLSPPELPTDMLDEVQALLLNRMRARFLKTTSPDGYQWPVSKAALFRAATGRDGKTGFDTGTMFHSIQAYLPTLTTRTIGTDVPYARFFQDGTKYMPPREFIGFGDDDVALVKAFLIRKLKAGLVS